MVYLCFIGGDILTDSNSSVLTDFWIVTLKDWGMPWLTSKILVSLFKYQPNANV